MTNRTEINENILAREEESSKMCRQYYIMPLDNVNHQNYLHGIYMVAIVARLDGAVLVIDPLT